MRKLSFVATALLFAGSMALWAQNKPLDTAQNLAKGDVPAVMLDGQWTNVDPQTRGIVRILVSGKKVHVWGSCHPTLCDWGVQKGQSFASSVDESNVAALLVNEPKGFSAGVMTISLESDGRLRVQRFSHYTDGRRSDATAVDYFSRGSH